MVRVIHTLNFENEEIKSELLTEELLEKDELFEEKWHPYELIALQPRMSIRGLTIGVGFGLLLWAAIIYAIHTLL